MADSSTDPEPGGTGMRPDRGSTTGTPRWVKVSGIVALVLVLLVLVVMLFVGGNHGPGRHGGSHAALARNSR
jgi:hypothetical protein